MTHLDIDVTLQPIHVDVQLAPPARIDVAAQGVPGPQGPPGVVGVSVQALTDLNALTVVKVMASNVARPASSNNPNDGEAVTGVTTVAARAGEQVPIRTSGALSVPGGGLTVGNLYLGPDGALTPNSTTGVFMLRIGYAATPTLLIVRIDPPVYHA